MKTKSHSELVSESINFTAKRCRNKFGMTLLFSALCIIIAVIANFFGSVLARNITLPLYLDSVLTLAVTALCGLWAGIACAVLSNGALWIFYNTSLPFTLCHILTAVCAYFTFRKYKIPKQSDRNNASGQVRNDKAQLPIGAFLWAGLWSAITNAISGNVLVSLLFASATSPNVDSSVQGIFIVVPNLTFATYYAGVLTNLTDKIISAVVSFGVYKAVKQIKV